MTYIIIQESEVVTETSDASKSKKSITLERNLETNKIVDGDEIKNEAPKEVSLISYFNKVTC